MSVPLFYRTDAYETIASPADLAQLLACYRFTTSTEAAFQEGVARVLVSHRLRFEREYVLTDGDRLDFYLPTERIVLELKIDGSPASVTRQLLRYASHPDVAGIVLATSRARIGNLLQAGALAGKPVAVFATWAGL